MNEVYGFVAEPHRNNYYLVSPASQDGADVTCHDLSGFLGSWKMKADGVFFPTISGETLCKEAMKNASGYAKEKNKLTDDKLAERQRWIESVGEDNPAFIVK